MKGTKNTRNKKYTPPIRRYSSKKWLGMTQKELRNAIDTFYREKLIGKTIVNLHKGITIQFNKKGREETRQNITPEKAVIVEHLLVLLKESVLSNIGRTRTQTHGENALFFLNFKIVCYIDGRKRSFRVPIIVRTNGTFHYSLHTNGIWIDKKVDS